MAGEGRRPPLSSTNSQASLGGDPFSDRPGLQFQEPPRSAYASTISLPQEFGEYDEGDEIEKMPLTSGGGGLYPPG